MSQTEKEESDLKRRTRSSENLKWKVMGKEGWLERRKNPRGGVRGASVGNAEEFGPGDEVRTGYIGNKKQPVHG